MYFNWIQRSEELEKAGIPFAIATVINTVAPTSAKPMAKAIITVDGKMEGWIGGGCSQDVIIKEAVKCIHNETSSIIRLSPHQEDDGSQSYKKNLTMSCESGGTLEFHIESVLPMTQMLIYGTTPAAEALAKMGTLLNYNVHVMGTDIDELTLPDRIQSSKNFESFEDPSIAIVATQGRGDFRALKAALASKPSYLALIASKRKGEKLIARLVDKGHTKKAVSNIKYPAGLNIGAVTPEEIAISIIAEIVRESRPKQKEDLIFDFVQIEEGQEKDPICGMDVDLNHAEYQSEYRGKKYYFCCSGCLEKFESEPLVYV